MQPTPAYDPAMTYWLVPTLLATTPPTPEVRKAVSQLSSILLVIALIGVVVVCGFVLVMLRKRSRQRAASPPRKRRDPGDAWAEAGARVPLEDDDNIPREPGSA